jgi:hypothetical protein
VPEISIRGGKNEQQVLMRGRSLQSIVVGGRPQKKRVFEFGLCGEEGLEYSTTHVSWQKIATATAAKRGPRLL